ncbi:hypothetical protein IPM19_01805 [bacterium]|nr:MAG: hypothetical protein IPM19_01805 [bacterium]
MENSPAKDASRDMFYDFVRKSFSARDLRSARAVVLLGKDRLEIPHLDGLGISRQRVTCVEHDKKVYLDLHLWNLSEPLNHKIQLFRYDLNDYLLFLLDRGQQIQIFNLDIDGSLQNNILPQFEKVIRMSKLQRKTVIGTYLTAGRDHHVLLRILQPAVWLMMYDPQFKTVIENLVLKFISMGYDRQVAFNHAFRLMHWVHAVLQIIVKVNYPLRAKVMGLDRIPDKFWKETLLAKGALTWEKVCNAAMQYRLRSRINSAQLKNAPTMVRFAAYRNSNWTQLCQFMKLEDKKAKTLQDVVEAMIEGLENICHPNSEYKMQVVSTKTSFGDLAKQEVLPKKVREELALLLGVQIKARVADKSEKHVAKRVKSAPPKPNGLLGAIPPSRLWNEKEKFTPQGRQLIRTLAHKGQKTEQIAAYFPKKAPVKSISAMIAISNRPRNRVLAD